MLRALTSADFPVVHASFVAAFSDYIVRFSPTPEQLREMLTRRGYVPELSFGVFDGTRMVAFTLNGVAGADAYDTGTGVVPSHRRRGLARAMMDESRRRLRAAGYSRYILEVIEVNDAAVALYIADGFEERRRLQCWSFSSATAEEAGEIEPPDWAAVRAWWDI